MAPAKTQHMRIFCAEPPNRLTLFMKSFLKKRDKACIWNQVLNCVAHMLNNSFCLSGSKNMVDP